MPIPLPLPQVSCVPWRLRIVWPWDVYFLLWNWVAVSLGWMEIFDGSWSWRRSKKSEVKSNLMNSSISGQGGFSWFVFATFFHFSPTWMPCPKHFAISPRIYCSFYWFYWVSRHWLDALAGSSCAVSLDFFSSVSCGFLSVFHLRYMPEQSHFHVVSWPTESRLYALEKHGKMKWHQMKPDLRPTINRQYGRVKLVNPYADQLPPILY